MSLLKALPDQCNIFTHYHAFFNNIKACEIINLFASLSPPYDEMCSWKSPSVFLTSLTHGT